MIFKFDLQRFKGNTTVENSYEPTEHELKLQRIAADYAEDVAPNAKMLNNRAAELLNSVYKSVKNNSALYEDLAGVARGRQDEALNGMISMPQLNREAQEESKEQLNKLGGYYQTVANKVGKALTDTAKDSKSQLNSSTKELNDLYKGLKGETSSTNKKLNSGIHKQLQPQIPTLRIKIIRLNVTPLTQIQESPISNTKMQWEAQRQMRGFRKIDSGIRKRRQERMQDLQISSSPIQ